MAKLKNKEFFSAVCLLIISLISEFFIFNFRYFTSLSSGDPHTAVAAADFKDVTDGTLGPNGLTVSDDSTFCIKNPGIPVNSLKLNTYGGSTFTVNVTYTDNGMSMRESDAGRWTIDPNVAGSDYIRFTTDGKCSQIKFAVSDSIGTPIITSVELNCPFFHFNLPRFLLLFIILLIIHTLRQKKLWDKRADIGNISNFNLLLAVYIAAALLSIVLYGGFGDIESFSGSVGSDGDCYRLLTEALSHGSLSFLQTPPQALKLLSNSYDPSSRTGFEYIFDSAYYNGHYYCYFGIAPVIILLLPFKLLTGLYMSTAFACFVFMLAMLFSLLMLYYNIVAKWFPDMDYMPFAGGAVVVVFGANLFWLIARPMFYELAVLSALCFLFLGFSLLIHASRGAGRRSLTLCFSGLCFGLMAASRVTFVFYLIAALPLLLPLLFTGEGFKGFGFKRAAAFFAPLAFFALLLMAYNYARFGSPFDFGQRYQLTVSDVRFNSLANLAAVPGGLYHYFFAPLRIDLTYPFFHIVQVNIETSSGYYYNQPAAGLFNFPLLLILFASPYILKRVSPKRGGLKAFTAALLIAALAITYIDITLAGVLERYTLDMGPVLTVVSLILWFEALDYFRGKGAGRPVAKLFFAVCLVTAVISVFCCSCGENGIQIRLNPQIYRNLASMLEFWR